MHIEDIVEALNFYKIRATYTAVAYVLGRNPEDIGGILGPHRPAASWIVGSGSGVPTNYSLRHHHPHLTLNDNIVRNPEELDYLVRAWRVSNARSGTPFKGPRSSRHTHTTPAAVGEDRDSIAVQDLVRGVPNSRLGRRKSQQPTIVYGVDWSGARDAGARAWLARGRIEAGCTHITDVFPGAQLPGATSKCEAFVPAMATWVAGLGDCTVGFDFPFGLPKPIMFGKSWTEFVQEFPRRFDSPDTFREWCATRANRKELKRKTDREANTPFSPYNLRMFRQTYWGIAGVLGPLVAGDHVRVIPFEQPILGKPTILEVCPASTLKRLGINGSYKGPGKHCRVQRESTLRSLIDSTLVSIGSASFKVAVENQGGDALDAVIAAIATGWAVEGRHTAQSRGHAEHLIEGFVFF